ncbi:hypothetical protein FNF31_00316 [Cafeteria roenbergensis]|uniref:Peroxin-7 n=1 Tax=Cafeteria roenbergensis TaxID=33653 RepID=A0A5A8DUU9_CAFRO|nr:hypothetical protein FNF28_03125 [Cafeteria roenbergensis]KAA0168434.1 hypothetical protein FNF31_00316 [Cafeteria roenbergensis]
MAAPSRTAAEPARQTRLPYAGLDVAWSPFPEGQLAVASAEHFGLRGKGALTVHSSKTLDAVARFDMPVGAFCVAWSEAHAAQLACGLSDGSVRLLDLREPRATLAAWPHAADRAGGMPGAVHALTWSPTARTRLASAGADGALSVWQVDVDSPLARIAAAGGRTDSRAGFCAGPSRSGPASDLWSAQWHPVTADVLACAGVEGCLAVWDLRCGGDDRPAVAVAAGAETLSVSWAPFSPATIIAGCTDHEVKVFDMRRPAGPVAAGVGHSLAVMSVAASPWRSGSVLSSSYDTSVAVWELSPLSFGGAWTEQRWRHHHEFASSVAWSCVERGAAASVGWDGVLAVLRVDRP